jgi:hypothetical protein
MTLPESAATLIMNRRAPARERRCDVNMINISPCVFLRIGAALLAVLVAACGSGESDSGPTCTRVNGVWNVSLDYGNGLVGHQVWTIVQGGCEVTLTADPPDPYGPALSSAHGNAGEAAMWANWTTTWGACRYYSTLDVKVAGDALAGTLDWARGAYGNGYCPGGFGTIGVAGQIGP